MAKLNYFLLCESFVVSTDNKASVMNIFDTIVYDSLPTIPLKMTFAISVHLKSADVRDSKATAKVTILKSNRELFQAQATFGATATTMVSALDLSGQLSLSEEGTYEAELRINETKIGSCTFFVKPKES